MVLSNFVKYVIKEKIVEGKKNVCSYFLSLSPNLAANPHESSVNPIGNIPLDRTDGICCTPPLLL